MTLTIEYRTLEGELFDTYTTQLHGWPDRETWERSVRQREAFDHFDEHGRAVFRPTGGEIKLIHLVDLR